MSKRESQCRPEFVQAFGHKTKLHKYKKKGKQKESTLQRAIVEYIKKCGHGYIFRIRNGATFDFRAGFFRANTAEPGIPDLVGCDKLGRGVFIEVKYIERVENKKKLTFKVNISEEQKTFLFRLYKMGALAGVAFSVDDARDIFADNQEMHPRHPRTWAFLPKEEIEKKATEYKKYKHENAVNNKDPLYRDVLADRKVRNGKSK